MDRQVGNSLLDQYYTPEWAATRIVETFLHDLSASKHAVIDAGCGAGPFLKAIPLEIAAAGVEVDPQLAEVARRNTGRLVITGDFATVPLPFSPTHIIGNPPFKREVLKGFIDRAAKDLPPEGIAAFLMPTASLSFSGPIEAYRDVFSIRHELLPRNLFPRIMAPISFVIFTKNFRRQLWGFALFDEIAGILTMPKSIKLVLAQGSPGRRTWPAAVSEAMDILGGEATLEQIYALVASNRPTNTQWWRDATRRELHEGHYERVDRGRWRKKAA
jgi:site-specific DNA-methyltransferase (adenine-specific)